MTPSNRNIAPSGLGKAFDFDERVPWTGNWWVQHLTGNPSEETSHAHDTYH